MIRGAKCLIVATAVFAAGTLTAAAAENGLSSRLNADRASIGANEDVTLRVTLRNTSAQAISLPYWQTPVRGIFANLFDVQRDGQAVAYIGRLTKWAAPRAEDMVTIPAGGFVRAKVELTAAYDISRTGEYTFRLRGDEGTSKRASNSVSIAIDRDASDFVDYLAQAQAEADAAGNFVTPGYVSCSSSRQTTLRSALGAAETMAQRAKAFTNAGTTGTAWTTWFGAYNASRYSTVNSHYNSIYNVFSTKTVTFYCDCTDSSYAYVFPNQPYKIHLCGAFWAAPLTGTDSKGGTLVHETSHFTAVAGTDDWAYGQSACRSLATSNPSRAIDNADTHEYFAEAR
ncbi:MAG TPA: M35 family metallo-endopeptidase [Thermoanaerobaculia bacterium]|jgi:peptidyl-Lys metalloendopeptidase|nr:M35 family metallo-endopeptidase [Thermoanaerobaculia bacterium]